MRFLLALLLLAAPSQTLTGKVVSITDTPRALIHFGDVDPLALIVASFATFISLLAFWLTWQETRRSNTPIVKMRECDASSEIHHNQCFQKFRILLHNQGISLWNVTVHIEFTGGEGGGQYAFEMSPTGRNLDNPIRENASAEFARGMLGEYNLNSAGFNGVPGGYEITMKAFDGLRRPRKQKARIVIRSQDYEASSIRIGGFGDRMKDRWNWLARKINWWFFDLPEPPRNVWERIRALWLRLVREVKPRSSTRREYVFKIAPIFPSLEGELMTFIRELTRGKSDAKGEPGK